MTSVTEHPEHTTTPGQTAEPSVAAVVVNHNGGARILRVLEALQRQTYHLTQVVVVDNNSRDGSPQEIGKRFPAVELLVQDHNLGLTVARNKGLHATRTTLVLVIDHDIYPEPTAVERMVAAYKTHDATALCPRIRLLPERDIVQMEGAAVHFLGLLTIRHSLQPIDNLSGGPGYVPACTGGCLLLQRQKILDIGGFDELFFFYFEDLELSYRLRARGHRIWCATDAEVFHEPAEGTAGLSYRPQGIYPRRRAMLTMRNRLLTILIHYRLRTILILLPALVLFEIAAFSMACKNGWAGAWLESWSWQIENAAAIRARRRRQMAARKLPDRAILGGGPPPLAPGLLKGRLAKTLFSLLSKTFNVYWAIARPWIA